MRPSHAVIDRVVYAIMYHGIDSLSSTEIDLIQTSQEFRKAILNAGFRVISTAPLCQKQKRLFKEFLEEYSNW